MPAFNLDKVVPWGRSLDEYVAMFALSAGDLDKSILGCSDGPASFNSLLTKQGGRVVSADPLYAFNVEQIRARIKETYTQVLDEARKNRHQFVWTHIDSPETLGRVRMAAMEEFLADFPQGLGQGRYIEASLPELPFADGSFALALCSHFLFLYSDLFSTEFHLRSVRELCRLAAEVRIFPLLDLAGKESPHLRPVLDALADDGLKAVITPVDYEFQRGANCMLQISHA